MNRSEAVRDAVPLVRATFAAGFVLSLGAGCVLTFFPRHTDSAFAWTIAVPASAAFIGAFYLASMLIAVLSLRRREWARVRAGLPGLIVFFWATLLATLLHLDRFHLGAGGTGARIAGWAWLIVYLVVPPATTYALVRQRAAPGVDRPGGHDLPTGQRALLVAVGGLLLGIGAVLFVAPSVGDDIWPWPVTPLTARTMAAWTLALGTALLAIARENDALRAVPPTAGIVLGTVLLAAGLARFPPDDWWAGAAYVTLLAVVCALGVSVLLLARGVSRQPAAPEAPATRAS